MFKKKVKSEDSYLAPAEALQEIWTPPEAEKVRYEWFARHILLGRVENQLNELEDQGYFDIEVREFLPGGTIANTAVFITARKVKETKNEK